MSEHTGAFPVLPSVAGAFSFVSGHLPQLMTLAKGPGIAALLIGALFGFGPGFQATPIFAIANVVAYAWFSFFVFRMVILGPDRARPPALLPTTGEAPSTRRSPLGPFLGRALSLAAAALGVFFLLTVLITAPLTLLDHAAPGAPIVNDASGYAVIDMLLISGALFCLPVGVPLARFSGALATAAVGSEAGFGVAWRMSRGFGVRLAVIWVVLAAPFFVGYALIIAALTQLSQLMDGRADMLSSVAALFLITAIGMTATALLSHATARAWLAMSAETSDAVA